jgi:hypothetical protein
LLAIVRPVQAGLLKKQQWQPRPTGCNCIRLRHRCFRSHLSHRHFTQINPGGINGNLL